MTTPGWWDHAFAFGLLVMLPAVAVSNFRSLQERAKTLGAIARIQQYRRTTAMQWGIVLLLGALWMAQGRTLPSLYTPGTAALVGAVVTAVVLVLLAVQWRRIQHPTPEQLASLREQIASLTDVLPQSAAEARAFRWLAITAGICEEILFRGFLLWYLGHWMTPWVAVLAGAAAFGIGHTYQGTAGMAKTALVGVFAGALYRLGGSLLWPMILHAAVDLQGGAAARRVLAEPAGVDAT